MSPVDVMWSFSEVHYSTYTAQIPYFHLGTDVRRVMEDNVGTGLAPSRVSKSCYFKYFARNA